MKPQKSAPEAPPAKWPVSGPGQLTIDHLPPKLRDELLRPERARSLVLGRALVRQLEKRNELIQQVASVVNQAGQGSEHLNLRMEKDGVLAALVELGLARVEQPQRGGDKA